MVRPAGREGHRVLSRPLVDNVKTPVAHATGRSFIAARAWRLYHPNSPDYAIDFITINLRDNLSALSDLCGYRHQDTLQIQLE